MNLLNLHKKSFQQAKNNKWDLASPLLTAIAFFIAFIFLFLIVSLAFAGNPVDFIQSKLHSLKSDKSMLPLQVIISMFFYWFSAESFRKALIIATDRKDIVERKATKNFLLVLLSKSVYKVIIPMISSLPIYLLSLIFTSKPGPALTVLFFILTFCTNIMLLEVDKFLLFIHFDKNSTWKNSAISTLYLFRKNYGKLFVNSIMIALYSLALIIVVSIGNIFSSMLAVILGVVACFIYLFYIFPLSHMVYSNIYLNASKS